MAARTDQEWSAALIRRMARLADQEMSAAQIAKALGLTRGQVLGKMRRLGLKTKNPPRKWLTTTLVEKLTKLIDQRLSANEIGQELGLTRPGRASREDTRTNQPRAVPWRNCQGTRANARPGPRQNASPRPQDEERSQPKKRPSAEGAHLESAA
jgi:hypothetical protein